MEKEWAVANFHTSQITTAHAKSFQSAVFTSHSLVTASNIGDSSVAPTRISVRRLP
jgi:hypothetical protein